MDTFKQRAIVADKFGWYFFSNELQNLCIAKSTRQKDNSDTTTVLIV